MKGALMAGTAGRQRASGLTLVEVLSTVFIMGLGLIMVAAAFPVGIDQVRRSVEDTQSAMAARSAVEFLHGENVFQNMTQEDWEGLIASGTTWAQGKNDRSNHFRVHNPWRRLYIDDTHEAMWAPEPGDFLWRAFLTRLTETDEMPLFRATIVVVKYSKQSPELYPGYPPGSQEFAAGPHHPFLGRRWPLEWPPPPDENIGPCTNPGSCNCSLERIQVVSRTIPLKSNNGKLCTGDSQQFARVVEGDYLMDPLTGFCYRVASFGPPTAMYLATEAKPPIPRNTECGIFSNVVGIYYTMISG